MKKSFYQPSFGKNKTQLPTEPIQSSKHPFLQVLESGEKEEEIEITEHKRGPSNTVFKMEARELADEAIARCLYANGLPFNLVRSPYWKEMIWQPSIKHQLITQVPGMKRCVRLLQKEMTSVDKHLQPIRASWKTSGISIVFDKWKDTRNRPLINVIPVSPKGIMFLKAVDCQGEVKESQFISRILIEAIEMVGSENVVQVVTNNAKNCRGASALVEGRYDHIFWTSCTIHSLNLIMQQIDTQIDWVKQIYQEGEEIQMFVTNHHMSQSIFRSFCKLELLKPIMTMLRFADTNSSCLGDVYDDMDTMVEKVKFEIQKHENDPTECEALCNKVEAIIHHRWEKMTTPLHLLAYALSPRYYSDEVLALPIRIAPYADEEVANGCYKAFVRLFQDEEMEEKVRLECGLFASGTKLTPYAIKV